MKGWILGDMTYEKYINSWQWKDKSDYVKYLRGNKCEKCGSKKKLQVHHLNYKSIGNEGDEDLMLLCNKCHGGEHGRLLC